MGHGVENLADSTIYISGLSAFETRSVDTFCTDIGTPSSKYANLKSIMAIDSLQTIASSLVD